MNPIDTRRAMIATLAVAWLGCGDVYPPERSAPANEAERAAQRAEDVRLSGPGYPALEGRVFHYSYEDFAGFRVLIERNRLKFQGVSGEFEGITKLQTPQFSAVDEGVTFMSWRVGGDMGDNVVLNLRDGTVFAHLGDGSSVRQLRGEIDCVGAPDECAPPEGRLQSTLEATLRVLARTAGSSDEAGGARLPTPAAQALEGKELRYRFDGEPAVALRVVEHAALVDEGQGFAPQGGTFTSVADELYFISWNGPHGGQHIVFNARTMEVHDQIRANGERVARVVRAESFGPIH